VSLFVTNDGNVAAGQGNLRTISELRRQARDRAGSGAEAREPGDAAAVTAGSQRPAAPEAGKLNDPDAAAQAANFAKSMIVERPDLAEAAQARSSPWAVLALLRG
jgi:hypothetical protein